MDRRTPDPTTTMKQRYIILALLILVPIIVDRTRTSNGKPLIDYLFGDFAGGAKVFYLLFIGVFIGLFIADLRGSLTSDQGRGAEWQQARRRRKGPFERQYLEEIAQRLRDFDTSGIGGQEYILRQDEAFEPLSLMVADQSNVPSGMGTPARATSIWEHLAIPQRRLIPRFWARDTSQRYFAILGSSGSGKTSLLRYVAIAFAQRQHTRFDPKMRTLTPLYLILREHLDAIKSNPQISLAQLIVDTVRGRWDLPQASLAWFNDRLQYGQCMILFDGLDEIPNEQERRLVTAWIQEQMKRWRSNYFLITSRPYGYYSNPIPGMVVLDVQSFNPSQIDQFVRRWYAATERRSAGTDAPVVRQRARERAEDLLQRLVRTADLANLATNPHLLTMIATVHRFLHKLPERRSELYKEICDVSLSSRRRPDDTDLTVIQKQRVLGPLAYEMINHRRNDIVKDEAIQVIAGPLAQVSSLISPEDFLKRTVQGSGLLMEREVDSYGFVHLTYQEYLAAVHIRHQRLEEELKEHVDDEWWRETILLFAAQDDSSHILETCLQRAASSERALSLGIRIVDEAISIRPDTKARFLRYLGEHVEQGELNRRRLIAEALLRNSLHQMASLDDKKQRSIGKVQINHASYQLFLDEQRTHKAHYFHPDHWSTQEFPSGQAREPVLGVRYSDAIAFCEWLNGRDNEGWTYRLPTMEESKSYHTGMVGKPRYWTSDGLQRFYGGWVAPQDMVRSILADVLYADLSHLQILALGQLIEQIRLSVRNITGSSAVRGERQALSSEQQIAREIVERGQLIDDLVKALNYEIRSVGEGVTPALIKLPALARAIQDKADLAATRFEDARKAAISSDNYRRRGDPDRALSEGARTDQLRGEALSPLRMIGESLAGIRQETQQLLALLPAMLRNSDQMIQHFQEALNAAGLAAFRALNSPWTLIQTNMLADVREHIYLPISEAALQDPGRAASFPLDTSYAAECARVFERTSAARPIQAPDERAYLRYWALLNSLIWLNRVGSPDRGEWTREQRERGLRTCRDLYVDLVLLEQRIVGRIHAVEGIRLVREPRF